MPSLFRLFPLKVWIGIGVVALIVALFGAYKFQEARANRATAEARTATATSDALDTVAAETDKIRTDEKEKADEVAAIPGSDDRLPDGYGARLECVRRGGERCNP